MTTTIPVFDAREAIKEALREPKKTRRIWIERSPDGVTNYRSDPRSSPEELAEIARECGGAVCHCPQLSGPHICGDRRGNDWFPIKVAVAKRHGWTLDSMNATATEAWLSRPV